MTKLKPTLYLHQVEHDRLPPIPRSYDAKFKPTTEYRETLPDMMVAVDAIQGANVPIQQVGVSNFKLPLRYARRRGGSIELETSVHGTVSLEANLKGINMSRIVRTFYEHRDRVFSLEALERVLRDYRSKVESFAARIRLEFSYPIVQQSLRSGLSGYQYYRAAYEGAMDRAGRFRKFIHFDFVYSSACPCSAELAEHARDTRGAYSIPHSQRSKARVTLEIAPKRKITLEEVQQHCLAALKTETQVMVKREDEQAFAEMNGAYIKFVEDAARLLHAEFDRDPRIIDFQIACSHLESLHSHDAISVICKGVPGGFAADFMDFGSLVC